jgi:peroxiredoxin
LQPVQLQDKEQDMTISIGDKLPNVTLKTNSAKGPANISTGDFFKGRKVVLFAVPGAFTPACSDTHLPGFVVHADDILKKADAIACLAVNDAFVLGAWQAARNAERITMMADGSTAFTKAVGLEIDLSALGLGIRSKRYALVANDGVVTYLGVDEDPHDVEKSSAETILKQL